MSERLNNIESFDVLGDVLDTLRFRGSIFFRSELAAPWGMSLEPVGIPRFHVALSGDCYVGDDETDAVAVQEMGIIMLPTGNSHWIADKPGRELVPSSRAGGACELGEPLFQNGKITNSLLCGIVHYDQESPHPLLDTLPDILHFPKLDSTEPIWTTVKLIDAETQRVHNRSGSIVDRLTEVLFLQLLNYHVENGDDKTGFFAALRDRRIQGALSFIHREPAFNWTLTSLGARVGMSRATLVRHFQDAVGVAPMTYVANWRIMKAYSRIKYTTAPLEQVAESTGFASARTMNRAFQRHYGYTPNKLRQSAKD